MVTYEGVERALYDFLLVNGGLDAHNAVRGVLKSAINDWISANGYDMSCTSNRLNFYLYAPYPPYRKLPSISIENASIFSWYGAVNKKTKWLNKITADGTGSVVSHVARTDPAFLGENKATDFAGFIKELNNQLKELLTIAWDKFCTNEREGNHTN